MRKIFTSMLALAATVMLNAQAGTLDPDFNGNGIVTGSYSDGNDSTEALVIQEDGKIIVGGTAPLGNNRQMSMSRYNSDGTLDTSFGDNGVVLLSTSFVKSYIKDLAVQPDGKIIFGGYQWNNVTGDFILGRLNEDGSLDSSFGTDGIAVLDSGIEEVGKSMALLDNGKIIISGDMADHFGMARVNPDGSLDTSFGDNGFVRTTFAFSSYAYGISIGDTGNIVLSGMVESFDYGGTFKMGLASYLEDGSLNTEFGDGGMKIVTIGDDLEFGVKNVQLPDGKILLSGHYFVGNTDLRYHIGVVRLNPDGSLDTTYGDNGVARFFWLDEGQNYLNDMVLHNGDLYLAGHSLGNGNEYFAIAKLDADGQLDESFGENGLIYSNAEFGTADSAKRIAVHKDNKIVITGNTYNFIEPINFVIARYLGDEEEDLGVQDLTSSDVKLYPNPASEQITVQWSGTDAQAQIEIFNLAGQKVLNTEVKNKGNVNVSSLTTGTYILKLTNQKEVRTIKFIKK